MSLQHYGQLEPSHFRPVKVYPPEAEAKLRADSFLTAKGIAALFREFDFQCFALPTDASFDATSTEALAAAAGTAIQLQTLSFANATPASTLPLSVPRVVAGVLRDSFTLQYVDLINCGIDADGAKLLAAAIPGNRTVHDWNIACNPLTDAGALPLAEALCRSAAQRISMRRCEITGVAKICASLAKLGTLVAVDLRGNPGLTQDTVRALEALQDQMAKNAQTLFPRSKCELNVFTLEEPAAGAGGEDAGDENGDDDDQQDGVEPSAGRRSQGGGGGNRRSQARSQYEEPSMTREEFEYSLRRWKRKGETPTSGRARSNSQQNSPGGASSSRHRSPAGGAGGAGQPPSVRGPSPSVTQAPIKHDAPTRDILYGVEDWKDVRNSYNQYICAPRKSESAAKAYDDMRRRALAKPTYCMGKRIDAVERSGQSAPFRGKPIATKQANPKEIQRNAPWLNQPQQSPGSKDTTFVPSAVGNKTYFVSSYKPNGDPVYSVVEDGGETTYLNNDPREVGYYARGVSERKIQPKEPWRRSNTQRDVRFGQDERDRGYVLKEQQAPDPGMYTQEDEWEKRARKLRERAKLREKTATERPLFGMTGAPRSAIGPAEQCHPENPGPGAYEIP